MRLLLDTDVLIALARHELTAVGAAIGAVIAEPENASFVSAASLWEIAIKTRLRKLHPQMHLNDLAGYFESIGLSHLAIDHRHAVQSADPAPATRDPFDRLLLAQCEVESLRLVTTDRVLAQHPLAWHPA